MKREYSVYKRLSVPQIVDDVSVDELLLDIIMADDEKDAVKQVAENTGLEPNNLCAEMHIASAYGKDMNRRIEAASFEDNEKIGIAVAVSDLNNTPSCRNLELSVDENGRLKCGWFILSWNDEYLDCCIVGGPYTEDDVRAAFRKHVEERLVELGVCETASDAEKLYTKQVSRFKDDMAGLRIIGDCASITYGGNCYMEYIFRKECDTGLKE